MTAEIELGRILLAVAGTALAAYQDARTSFIDEKLTYFMIAAGIIASLATMDVGIITYALGGGLLIFGIGYALYRAGQVGGGDVLLFTGIFLLIPLRPTEFATPLLGAAFTTMRVSQVELFQALLAAIPFFLSVFTATGFFSLFGSALFYATAVLERTPKPETGRGAIALAFSLAILGWMYANGTSTAQLLFFVAVLAPTVFLIAFRRQIMDEIVVANMPLSKIEDEDVLVTDRMNQRIVKKYKLGRVLTKSEVEKLKLVQKKEGIRAFPIAKVLPRLGPYILLGLLATLLVGDLFAFFIAL